MGNACTYHVINDQFTTDLIRRKARQLVGRSGFTQSDCSDIEQELRLHVILRSDSFDSRRAHWAPFVTAMVDRLVADILRRMRSQKRGHGRVCSLNDPIGVDNDCVVERADLVAEHERTVHRGSVSLSGHELATLKADMCDTIATLSPELRWLAEAMKTDTVTEIARRSGVPRTTLNDRIRKIRRRFERAGLREYL